MGAPAQALPNEHLLLDADIVVGILGTRIGTATEVFISRCVEKIKGMSLPEKFAMLYFSHVPVDPNAIDPKQWTALQSLKKSAERRPLSEYAPRGNSHRF